MAGWSKKPFDDAEMTMAKVFSKLWWRWRVWWWRVGFSYNWAALNTGGAGAALHMEHKTPTASTASHHHHHFFQRVSSKNWGLSVRAFLFSQIHFTEKNTALHCHSACPWSAVSLQWQADHTQRHRQTGWVSHILYVCKNSMTGRPHTDTHMDGRGGRGGRTAWKCKALTCLLICTNVSVHVLMY